MKRITLIAFICIASFGKISAQKQLEKLNRGITAVKTADNAVYIGWRLLATDPADISFNIYSGKKKLNNTPVTSSTNFVDTNVSGEEYSIKAVVKGKEQKNAESVKVNSNPYISIPLSVPAGGKTPSGQDYSYNANDASVGDVDGDGEYEIILKWDPSNAKDNSQKGYTGNVYLDAYKLDGKKLWRIDLGRNIRAGAHYTQFMVYDFDGDGKAEIICKTADGTTDGTGKVIGDSKADFRNESGYVLSGPEFLTVFEGSTGKALDTQDFYPKRDVQAGDNPTPEEMKAGWGDAYGNRIDRYVSAVAYLAGKRPSFIAGRGYYTRLVRTAWDFRNGKLERRWIFDSKDEPNAAYAGMGNHSMTVGDVDVDGKDEIINGSSVIDDDGNGLYSTGLGHGDALHMSDMDPTNSGLEIWQSYEEPKKYVKYGLGLKDAKTGKTLWGVDGEGKDVGRAMAADIDPTHPGYEYWGAVGGLYNSKGEKISDSRPSSMNFAVWWDADLTRELLDKNRIDKWDYKTATTKNLFTAEGFTSNNGTKGTPALSADLFGDWREEVILRKEDNSELRIYTTTIPSTNRFVTLMQDSQYRVAVAWQNSSYNQPPHPSFFLGEGMKPAPFIKPTSKK
ncbi:rhamnogalacturonan lyase [Dyadobacter psychrotolerans]|uniref:Rhamnogalacturonan lyase n=1 Tax=Dyadobacter psychrotolerans TaxID=2541721 RepID=A0A4R5DQJ7_9BACT|nr:rhamnogalacturonan lyase [Dyadobacter psychrotolerans]TDE16652.1 rhamnogalacturonan lyase [Dyadobacter psychrotolerans]